MSPHCSLAAADVSKHCICISWWLLSDVRPCHVCLYMSFFWYYVLHTVAWCRERKDKSSFPALLTDPNPCGPLTLLFSLSVLSLDLTRALKSPRMVCVSPAGTQEMMLLSSWKKRILDFSTCCSGWSIAGHYIYPACCSLVSLQYC